MSLNSTSRVRRTHLYWHLVFFALVLAVLFVVLRGISQVLTPVITALVLSYLLDPLVGWLQRRLHMPRWLGTTVIFLLSLLLLVTVLVVVIPLIVRELRTFAEAIPGYVSRLRASTVPWLERTFHISPPDSLSDLPAGLVADLKALASKLVMPLGGMAGRVAQGTASLFSAVGTLLLIPVFTFYFLPLFPKLVRGAEELIPRRYLPTVRATARDIDRALAAWIRGQLTVMAVLAIYYAVGLSIVGVKLAVLIGLLTGLLAFIPYVGVVVGLSMALLVSLLEYHGLGTMIGIAVVFGLAQTLDGLLLTPKIVGYRVGLGPVGVLLALMLGAHLFGFTGVLLAVPAAAALVVIIRRVVAAYKSSQFYRRGASEPAPLVAVPPASAAGGNHPVIPE
jgi:predicted PurR-regulated permease PerM